VAIYEGIPVAAYTWHEAVLFAAYMAIAIHGLWALHRKNRGVINNAKERLEFDLWVRGKRKHHGR